MKLDIYSYLWFGLASAISYLALSRSKRRLLSGLFIFFINGLLLNIAVVYEIGETLTGFILFHFVIMLFMILVQIIVNKNFKGSYAATAAVLMFIIDISDALSVSFTRFVLPLPDGIYSVVTIIITFILSAVGRFTYDSLRKQPKREKLFYVFGVAGIISFMFFIVIFIWTLNLYRVQNNTLRIVSGIIFLLVVSLFILSMIYYGKYMKLSYEREITEKETANIIQSTKMIESAYEKLRGFRHDYKNILLSLSLKEDSEGMVLLRKWEEEFVFVNSQYENVMMQLMKINNLPFRSLVASKAICFINDNISIDINVIGEIQEFYMEDLDLIRILGILLDNAFEEAQYTEERWIRIGILAENEAVTIVIENSCRETTPTPDCLIEKGFSIKGKERGFGLSNVSEIIGNYKRCLYQLGKREENPNVFYVELTLRED